MAWDVGYESWLERDQVMWLDWDPDGYRDRLAAVSAVVDGRGGRGSVACADYFAHRAGGPALVIDCRRSSHAPGPGRFEATARAFALAGWGDRLLGATGPGGRATCGGWPGTGTRAIWYRGCRAAAGLIRPSGPVGRRGGGGG